jgi:hypothetical protein
MRERRRPTGMGVAASLYGAPVAPVVPPVLGKAVDRSEVRAAALPEGARTAGGAPAPQGRPPATRMFAPMT